MNPKVLCQKTHSLPAAAFSNALPLKKCLTDLAASQAREWMGRTGMGAFTVKY
jgi:hypothetical protein